MELEVYWTQLAENKLQAIFSYYVDKAGLKIARKVVNQIVDRTVKLKYQPYIGVREELLKNRSQEFRYLVSTNYKIIYYINLETKRIMIANVFDARQNPIKMQET